MKEIFKNENKKLIKEIKKNRYTFPDDFIYTFTLEEVEEIDERFKKLMKKVKENH